jgi:hypothetical protein
MRYIAIHAGVEVHPFLVYRVIFPDFFTQCWMPIHSEADSAKPKQKYTMIAGQHLVDVVNEPLTTKVPLYSMQLLFYVAQHFQYSSHYAVDLTMQRNLS